MDEGTSDSDYDSDVEVDRSMKSQSSSLTGDGIATKAGRAMQFYPGEQAGGATHSRHFLLGKP